MIDVSTKFTCHNWSATYPHKPYGMSLISKNLSTIICALFLAGTAVDSRAEMNVDGLDDRQAANVMAMSPLATTGCDSARWRIERLFRDADREIITALRALGYYEPRISKSLRWSDDCWHADFTIDPGKPVRLRNVDVQLEGDAAGDPAMLARGKALRPAAGDVFDHGEYTDFKASLLRAATNSGYFEAEYEVSEVLINKEERTADLSMRLQSGTRYRFGEVSFTSGILRERLLQGYVDIEPGDKYSSQTINELYEALNGSGYFASVSINTEPLDTDQHIVPVDVQLVPAKRRVYTAGAGFSTDLGPNGRLGYTDRRINDRGHQFDGKLFVSPVISELDFTYRWPKKDPRREWFSIVSGFQHEKTDTSEQDSFKLGFRRSRNLDNNWLQTRYLDYLYEDFTVADQNSSSQLIIFGTNWETARGRALGRSTSGFRINADVRGAAEALGSDTSFLQVQLKAKWVYSLTSRTRVLARATVGMTRKDMLAELPASVRFFAGGDNSVRGYAFESLGPEDEDGKVIGGSNQLDASLEIDRQIGKQWAIAAFVDSGDAFDETDIDFNTGVGVGFRWYSPVGPLRLDFAHPLDNPDENIRIHISLGPDL